MTLLSGAPEAHRQLGGARLILTAVCLHLYPVAGPDPTLKDVHAFLVRLARPSPEAWDALKRSPSAIVQYAAEDLNAGRGKAPKNAISVAIRAVKAKLHTKA